MSWLRLRSYASPSVDLPDELAGSGIREREEFVLDLGEDPATLLDANHRRNVKRALAAGVSFDVTSDPSAVAVHLQLMRSSLHRRQQRGEAVPVQLDGSEIAALVAGGAGTLFRAVVGDEVLSSILILRSAAGAYYHSAGTSPAGMERGTAHALVLQTAQALRTSGARVFNLGGASREAEGLRRFKLGFGARAVRLRAVDRWVGSTTWRIITQLIAAGSRLARGAGPGTAGEG